jgi:hypothetical protein
MVSIVVSRWLWRMYLVLDGIFDMFYMILHPLLSVVCRDVGQLGVNIICSHLNIARSCIGFLMAYLDMLYMILYLLCY